jgi:hypothetical protein
MDDWLNNLKHRDTVEFLNGPKGWLPAEFLELQPHLVWVSPHENLKTMTGVNHNQVRPVG